MKANEWEELVREIKGCRLCHNAIPSLVEKKSFPLFMKESPSQTKILFVGEAPNYNDTYDKNKGYLTINSSTDPSGKLLYQLLTNTLQLSEREFCFTNVVLCLPKRKGKNYLVTSKQIELCLPNLVKQINTINPKIVCTIGLVALKAIRKIEDHGYKSLKEAVGKRISWNNRILFPLYHTSLRARFGATGRSEKMQIEDWKRLKVLYDEIK